MSVLYHVFGNIYHVFPYLTSAPSSTRTLRVGQRLESVSYKKTKTE